jgi:glycerophosphoryl diester phosphodiesterase
MSGLRWRAALGRPAVIAHRGASRKAPENSLEALRLAREEGADGVEFDVQRCGSGELVVFHDRTLARCTGHPGTVTETPLSALQELTLDRVSAHFGLGVRGARIPTLDEWLRELPAGFLVNLEVKVESLVESSIAGPCVDSLAAAGALDRAVVSSFYPPALIRIRTRQVARGALIEAGSGWRTRLVAGLAGSPAAIHPDAVLVTPQRVTLWHALGYQVATWTVDAPDEIRRVLDAGVDAVITNRPDTARPLAEQRGSR